MNNYLMIDGKKISISDETAANMKKQLSEEETYSVGDILVYTNDTRTVVTCLPSGEIALVVVKDTYSAEVGTCWNNKSIKVENIRKITADELSFLTTLDWQKVEGRLVLEGE